MKRNVLALMAILVVTLTSCSLSKRRPETMADFVKTKALVGTWEAKEPAGKVTYKPDGTWESCFVFAIEGAEKEFRGTGTWKIEDGTILNTTLSLDGIPGMEKLELPYLSREKIVS